MVSDGTKTIVKRTNDNSVNEDFDRAPVPYNADVHVTLQLGSPKCSV